MVKASRYRDELEDCGSDLYVSYLGRAPFEDCEEYDYRPNYDSGDDEFYDSEKGDLNVYDDVETHRTIKRYVQQIRDSCGFEVDCRPPRWFNGKFFPVNLDEKNRTRDYDDALKAAEFAIREINAETSGKTYKFVELKNAVSTINFFFLLTITAKEELIKVNEEVVEEDVDTKPESEKEKEKETGVVRTIQAIVYFHFTGLIFEQWRFKPDTSAAAVEDA